MGKSPHSRNHRATGTETSRGSWLITFSDKVSVLGTLVVMLVGVALFAIIERALITRYTDDSPRTSADRPIRMSKHPARSGRTPERVAPTTPAEVLQDQAAARVLALRGARVRQAYRAQGLPWPVVQLSRVNGDRTWAFGTAVIPTPADVAAMPDSSLFLARTTGSGAGWTVEFAGTAGFRRLLDKAPTSVVPKAERRALSRYGAVPGTGDDGGDGAGRTAGDTAANRQPDRPSGRRTAEPTTKPTTKPSPADGGGSGSNGAGSEAGAAAGVKDTGLMLPWRAGQSWSLRKWTQGEQSLRFDGGKNAKAVAVGDGRLYRLCSTAPDRGLIMVIHENGLASQYYQLADTLRMRDGSPVRRGAYLGRVSTDRPCGGQPAARPELRFALRRGDAIAPLDSAWIGGWTIHTTLSDTWADRAGARVDAGEPLRNFGAVPPRPVKKPADPDPAGQGANALSAGSRPLA